MCATIPHPHPCCQFRLRLVCQDRVPVSARQVERARLQGRQQVQYLGLYIYIDVCRYLSISIFLYIYISARCQAQNNQKYCKSVQGDCRHIQGACPPEQCVYQEKLNKYLKVDIYN